MKLQVLKISVVIFLLILSLDQGIAQRSIRHDFDDVIGKRYTTRPHGFAPATTDTTFTVIGRWAWGSCEAVEAQGKLAYIGNGPTVQILDISNTASPTIIGEYTTPGYVTDIKVRDSLAYVASGTLQILNVSNPSFPTLLASVNINLQSIERVAVADSFVYVSGYPGGVFVVDVTDPTNPRVRGSFYPGGEFAQCFVANGRFIYFGNYETSDLSVLDATNPDSLKWTYSTIGGVATAGFVRDTILFLGVGFSGSRSFLKIFNVSNPDTAIFLGQVEISDYTPGNTSLIKGVVADSVASYVSTDSSKVFTVDVSIPSEPKIRATHIPSPVNTWGGASVAKSGQVLLVAQASGLEAFDAANIDALPRICFFPTGGRASKIFVKDNLAFVASFFSGLWIVDVSDPQIPRSVSNINVGGQVVDVIVSDTIAYLANYNLGPPDDSSRGLWVIDISDVHRPQVLSHYIGIARYDGLLDPNSIARLGDLIVMTQAGRVSDDTTMEVIDVSHPMHPSRVSSFAARYSPYTLAIKDSIAFVANLDSGLHVVDLHNPSVPVQLTRLLPNAVGIAIIDSFAFVFGSTMNVLDISNAHSPTIVSSIALASNNVDAVVSVPYLYAADGDLGAIDISSPASPVYKGTFSYAYLSSGVAANGSTVYFGDDREGMWILRNNLVTQVEDKARTFNPKNLKLFQNYPNPFNPQTTIEYSLPTKSRVLLEIYNVLGQRIQTLVDEVVPTGAHKVSFDGSRLASGVYFYRLTAEGMTQTRKLVMCK